MDPRGLRPADGHRDGGASAGPRHWGYLAACAGTVSGAFVGLAVGQLIGLPLAAHVARDVAGDSGDEAEGAVEAAFAAIGAGVAAAALAGIAFVVAVVLTIWFGAGGGCWLALRVAGGGWAGRTALLAVGVAPPVTLAVLIVTGAITDGVDGTAGYMVLGLGAVLTGLAARRLAVR